MSQHHTHHEKKIGRFPIIPHTMKYIPFGLISIAIGFRLFFSHIQYSIQFTGGMELVLDTVQNEQIQDDVQQAIDQSNLTKSVVNLGEKNNYPTLVIQANLDNDELVTKLSEVVQTTLIEKNHISDASKILEQSVI
jgi:preprotein translocase subunit SecF